MITDKEIKETQDWIKIQLENIHPDTSGIMIFNYGTEDYMVSGIAAKKVMRGIAANLEKAFPKLVFLMLPFWIKADTIKDLEEFMG